MTKEQIEWSKAISRGVSDGIVKALKRSQEQMTLYDHLQSIRKMCDQQKTCYGCPLAVETNEVGCLVQSTIPSRWQLDYIKQV